MLGGGRLFATYVRAFRNLSHSCRLQNTNWQMDRVAETNSKHMHRYGSGLKCAIYYSE